jgi:hypothetical protein
VLGVVGMEGSLDFRLNGTSHGQILKAALGSCVTTGAGPYTHTLKVGSTLPSYTAEVGYTDISQWLLFTGMRCGSLGFKVNPAGFLECTSTWMGKGEHSTSPVGSTMDSGPDNYTDAVFSLAGTSNTVSEGGGAIGTLLSVEFSLDNQLDGSVYTVASGGSRGDLPAGFARVSGKLEAMFDGVTLYNKAKAGTETSLAFEFVRGTGAGSAGNEKLSVYLDEVYLSRAAPPIEGPTGVKLALDFIAVMEDDADASALRAVLLNSVVSYA